MKRKAQWETMETPAVDLGVLALGTCRHARVLVQNTGYELTDWEVTVPPDITVTVSFYRKEVRARGIPAEFTFRATSSHNHLQTSAIENGRTKYHVSDTIASKRVCRRLLESGRRCASSDSVRFLECARVF